MRVYIDENFKCHGVDSGGLSAVETDFFNGKCRRFIEGYRFVPAGESWTREDGRIFTGEMAAPAEDSRLLETAQTAYEEALETQAAEAEDMKAALDVLGVEK